MLVEIKGFSVRVQFQGGMKTHIKWPGILKFSQCLRRGLGIKTRNLFVFSQCATLAKQQMATAACFHSLIMASFSMTAQHKTLTDGSGAL